MCSSSENWPTVAVLLFSLQICYASLFPTQSGFPVLMSSFERESSRQQQLPPRFLSEQQLYGNIDLSRYTQGYDVNAPSNSFERINNPVVELPPIIEQTKGRDQVFNHYVEQLPQTFPTPPPQPQRVMESQERVPAGITEQMLYANLGNMEQYMHGYDDTGGKVERVNMPVVVLPEIHEERQGTEKVFDTVLPDKVVNNRVENKKEIHSYTEQKRVTNVSNRKIHRYLKTLLVNTTFNTDVQRINHEKEIQLLVNQLQAYHLPKLVVQYARQDAVKNLPDLNATPEVKSSQETKVLPPLILPATVERLDYNNGNAFRQNSVATSRSDRPTTNGPVFQQPQFSSSEWKNFGPNPFYVNAGRAA